MEATEVKELTSEARTDMQVRIAALCKMVKQLEGEGMLYVLGDRVWLREHLFKELFGTGPDVEREKDSATHISLIKRFAGVEFRSLFKIPDGIVVVAGENTEPVKKVSLYDVEL